MKIDVNNKRSIEITETYGGVIVDHFDNNGEPEQRNFISDGDIVMLLNYYYNCKNGTEESDYIRP